MSLGIDIGKFSIKLVELDRDNEQINLINVGSINTFDNLVVGFTNNTTINNFDELETGFGLGF